MKVILQGFKMQSEVLEWPEKTEPYIKIALTQPLSAIVDSVGNQMATIGPVATIAEFEWTGKYFPMSLGEYAKIYVLRDIYKLP